MAAALLTSSKAASQKSEMEQQISTALRGVKDRLPGFRIFQQIYSNDSDLDEEARMALRRNILLAYVEFIDMVMEIVKYFLRGSLRKSVDQHWQIMADQKIGRWTIAILQPSKFKEMSEVVQERVLAVRLACEELASVNISQIKAKNTGTH